MRFIDRMLEKIRRDEGEPANEKLSIFAAIASCRKFLVETSLGSSCLICKNANATVSISTLRNPTLCIENVDKDDVLLANYVLHCAENILSPFALAATVRIDKSISKKKANKLINYLKKYSPLLIEAMNLLPDSLPPISIVKDGERSQSIHSLIECPMRYVLIVSKYGVAEGKTKYFVFFLGWR